MTVKPSRTRSVRGASEYVNAGPFLTDSMKGWDMEAFDGERKPLWRSVVPASQMRRWGRRSFLRPEPPVFTTGSIVRIDGGMR